MFPILEKKQLAEAVYSVVVEAPDIARRALAGQFVILRLDETGERFPLTLCDWSAAEGWIRLVLQVVGRSTRKLSLMEAGEGILDLVGPLGRPAEICAGEHVVCVGGGVGIAAIHPICRALREAGNRVTGIIGARTDDLLILEEEMTAVTDELVLTTDDGSRGIAGRVTWALEELLKKDPVDLVIAIGPAIMMKFASAVTRGYDVPTRVSLNSIMLDGTGMCGTCRCEVEGKTRFACVDGPEFDGHAVDWGLLLSRLDQYKEEEEIARSLP
ncbi:MAG: sulfide/dihydroorotate dehydrogenase-like FAD/NAD-binding protein [Actinomycetota bacterium]|nr:sulfide/dihydroorotate dehydrogenase-like FAD/NAD-binding protein [Actinomycetota bacterium]MDD5668121.1 sulfide/dihydroorotate dehydrogenase-like FAD/NAD-binding protein [Actinomycetota bacterium]